MKDFPIKFGFDALDYSARVAAFGQNSQFHITGFIPEISGIELPFVIYKRRDGSFTWASTKDIPQKLGQTIFDAIKKSQKL